MYRYDHLEPLPSFGWSGSFAIQFFLLMPLSNSNIWFTTLDALDQFAKILHTLSCIARACLWNGGFCDGDKL
jgi:hypothetical protein